MKEGREFRRIMKSYQSQDLPPVEVVTDKFRAVAKNFFELPVTILFELKAAQQAGDGTDLMLLFDAAALAFDAKDMERLKELNIRDFLNVIYAWVNFDKGY